MLIKLNAGFSSLTSFGKFARLFDVQHLFSINKNNLLYLQQNHTKFAKLNILGFAQIPDFAKLAIVQILNIFFNLQNLHSLNSQSSCQCLVSTHKCILELSEGSLGPQTDSIKLFYNQNFFSLLFFSFLFDC